MLNTQSSEQPWLTEPDREEFQHAGFHCLLNRVKQLGHWCAYVAVPPGHPYYGKKFNDCDIEVHGGLTYSEHCDANICHEIDEGGEKVWWLGFDCAHEYDYQPYAFNFDILQRLIVGMYIEKVPLKDGLTYGAYRDITYVREETKRLAEQLRKVQDANE